MERKHKIVAEKIKAPFSNLNLLKSNMISFDYHIHTNYSSDAHNSVLQMAQTADTLGLKSIYLTDHEEMYAVIPSPTPTNFINRKIDIEEARVQFPNIYISNGVEVGLNPDEADEIINFIKQNQFDFVIGAIHKYERKEVYYNEYERTEDYFSLLYESIKAIPNFNIVAHIDRIYIAKGVYVCRQMIYKMFKGKIDAILKLLIDSGRGLEVNMNAYYFGEKYPYPSLDILRAYKQFGGEILTLGSDAHADKHLEFLMGFQERTFNHIKEAGFDRIMYYQSGEYLKCFL